jgi:ribonucleoside-diphosphate reductase alpha chain
MFNEHFRTSFGRDIFNQKYPLFEGETWAQRAHAIADDVCSKWLHKDTVREIERIILDMKFVPAGRYIYYAGRPVKFFNNCFSFIIDDSREGWSKFMGHGSNALMCGGGIGGYFGHIRPRGSLLKRTGGVASGPVPLMDAMNGIAREMQQGGSRRSACYASLPWWHQDIQEFITAKNWSEDVQRMKAVDFNYPARLDMTNISVGFDDAFFQNPDMHLWHQVVTQMCRTGEPGMMFNLGAQANELGRNACAEFISAEKFDVCNLGSLNFSRIRTLNELKWVTYLAAQFLMCGSLRSELPFQEVRTTRQMHRKIGVGIMGMHEWMLQRGHKYGMSDELRQWLTVYKQESERGADEFAYSIGCSKAERYRAIAPSGTISILAGTTSGIEPIFAICMRRRYLVNGSDWKAQYIIDPTAEAIANDLGIDPDTIETAYSLAAQPERRIKFQAEVQKFVDMGISSTINLPDRGSDLNNEFTDQYLSDILFKYAPMLRGITAYPNNGRAGQTITAVPYHEAKQNAGVVYDENEAVSHQCKSGVCSM